MDAKNGTIEHRLDAHAALVLTGAAGVEVICREGCIWLTQYGDSRDIVLNAGQTFMLSLSSVVLMSSTRGASIAVRRVAPASSRSPVAGLLRRLLDWLDPRTGAVVARQLRGRVPTLDLGGAHRAGLL